MTWGVLISKRIIGTCLPKSNPSSSHWEVETCKVWDCQAMQDDVWWIDVSTRAAITGCHESLFRSTWKHAGQQGSSEAMITKMSRESEHHWEFWVEELHIEEQG